MSNNKTSVNNTTTAANRGGNSTMSAGATTTATNVSDGIPCRDALTLLTQQLVQPATILQALAEGT
jgi:hypothetical protein